MSPVLRGAEGDKYTVRSYTTIDEYHYRVSDKELEDSLLFDLNARRIIIIICYNYIMIMLQYLNMKLLFLF